MPSLLGVLKRGYNWTNKRIARAVVPLVVETQGRNLALVSLGEGEGAWIVPVELIKPGAVCYCVGVGLNASFDVALARDLHAQVHSFDPTPSAIAHMGEIGAAGTGIDFHPWGLWKTNARLRFFAPMNRRHANYSVRDIHATGEYFEAECFTLGTLMERLGHRRIDLLKMDIEGAWRDVLDGMLGDGVLPSILCVEFDTPTSLGKVLRMIARLRGAGLSFIHRNRDNYLFVAQDLLKS
ncbi:MAG: FkbM family methyltransferase [Rhizomicrobium sp.]